MASSVLESSEEKIYGFKLMRLIVDGGTEALRNVFLSIHPGILHNVLATHYLTLYHLKTTRIINQTQWDKLYPHPPKLPNIQEFDITLLVILLRNICSLSPPSSGWNVSPSSSDNSREANIVRVRLFRNHFFGHVPGTDVSRLDFEARWVEVSSALRGLGLRQASIDRLKAEECGEEEVNRVRKEWNESEREIMSKLDRFETMLKKDHEVLHESLKQAKSFTEGILRDCLDWCDFESEIELLYENYTEGTREWVFQEVSTWLNDTTSDNRAFIISGQAGMGKSTIAAVSCKRFPKKFAACHFFQYNNSRYNNPKIFLQSLACQLSNVIPEYKQNLTSKLSGEKGKKLQDQNIEGMFSTLFKEPFTNIPDPGKYFLIVIDALDECRKEERYELVDLIGKHFHKFPKFIKFLITTRSEQDIANKFHELNPLFLQPDDERNLTDLRIFFEEKLKTTTKENVSRKDIIEVLVGKSEGLMLYASFLCKLSEDGFMKKHIESLPKGIEEVYESYFSRLESELRNLGIDEENFLKFLSVIVIAKKVLPLGLIERLLSPKESSLSARRTLKKLVSRMSSLFVIKDDCVSFFHKSVKDWLVKSNHDFTITEETGHKLLAAICADKMETLKQNEVTFTYDLATQYALQYGIPHMLQMGVKDMHSPTKLMGYATDLEILHASVCINVYATLNNLVSLESHNSYNSLCPKTGGTLKTLINIMRKYVYILKDLPHSFLQHVVNEHDDEISSKASTLLLTRYKRLAYFELVNRNENIDVASLGRILTKCEILNVDISPSEDFVICAYYNGIELFSLVDFKSLWKVDHILKTSLKPTSCVVFHPLKNIIFPAQLDPVLNLEGKYESGPIACEENLTKFSICCFSHDNTKMATYESGKLTVWNMLENKETVTLPCELGLFSVMFSANGRFMATNNSDSICVYDTENNYSMISKPKFNGKVPFVFVSTLLNSDSWYYSRQFFKRSLIVSSNLEFTDSKNYVNLWPGNAKAAAHYDAAMKSKDSTWLDVLGHAHGIFFILNNGMALVNRSWHNELKIFRTAKFFPILNSVLKCEQNCAADIQSISSVDGEYIYISNQYGAELEITMLSCTEPTKLSSLVQATQNITSFVFVTNGVFLCRANRLPIEFNGSIPELWNSDMTRFSSKYPELTGTFRCLPVTDNLAACVMESQVCFFDVVKEEIAARTQLPKYSKNNPLSKYRHIVGVIACGSQYHVVMSKGKCILLLQGTTIIDLSSRVLNNLSTVVESVTTACFSPNGRLLAFLSNKKRLYILDTLTLNIRCDYPLQSERFKLEFVDDEHLLCARYGDCLCLFDVKTSEIVTYINVGMSSYQWRYSFCRKRGVIVVRDLLSATLKLIKLWLPHQRKDVNEFVEDSFFKRSTFFSG